MIKGDVVEVFNNSVGSGDVVFEGHAKLLAFISSDSEHERWKVIFKEDGFKADRNILKSADARAALLSDFRNKSK